MKRVLITDDERPITESISHMIRRDMAEEFEVCAIAHSGKESMEKAAQTKPDIILMDVRMPGLSGLDAIREIRKRNTDVVFILITAYERFDIAREALELGVLDYLLKPVAKDKLAAALRNAVTHLEQKQDIEQRVLEQREMAEHNRDLTERNFLQAILLDQGASELALQHQNLLGLETGWVMLMALAIVPGLASSAPRKEADETLESIKDLLKYKTQVLVSPLVGTIAALVFPARSGQDPQRIMGEVEDHLARAWPALWRQGNLRTGRGLLVTLDRIEESWSHAKEDLFRRHEAPVPGRPGDAGGPSMSRLETDEDMVAELLASSPEKASLSMERVLQDLSPAPGVLAIMRGRFASIFGTVYRRLVQRGVLMESATMRLFDFSDLEGCASPQALTAAVRQRLNALARSISDAPRGSPLVVRTLAWIRENYARQITLELAADEAGISPNRLSKLIVEETGKGFSDLLIDYRISRAKELLVQPGQSVKQVSVSCGYLDPNYFARLFKRITGLTPSAYANGIMEDTHGKD